MAEFISRNNGLFFEPKLTPEEKKEAEYRKRLRDLEKRVYDLTFQVEKLSKIIENKEA